MAKDVKKVEENKEVTKNVEEAKENYVNERVEQVTKEAKEAIEAVTKVVELLDKENKEEILELRKRGLSIAKIVEYLKKAYKIKTTTEYLKKIIPEVAVSKEEYLLRQMKSMTNDQIVRAILRLEDDRALEIAEKIITETKKRENLLSGIDRQP